MKIYSGFIMLLGSLLGLTTLLGYTTLIHARPATSIPSETAVAAPLCRFGVNHADIAQPEGISAYDVTALRSGWYVDYFATPTPQEPNGMEYVPVIKLEQVGANDFSYEPNGADLIFTISQNPSARWLIGNEPDSSLQNNMEPHVYAKAYHELYNVIKAADPTAFVIAGTIVQPTMLRLQYLDMVLAAYRQNYGTPMPVDGWSVHNFILNEVSCNFDPSNCWGAGIPVGVNAPFGEVIGLDDNDNIALFKERIMRFRQWMADSGYGGYPLYLTEYGVLMPQDFGFPSSRVNAFMNASFDYMLTATDPALGDPADSHHLVQSWSWYSTGDNIDYNGWLFDKFTKEPSAMGANYATYTGPLADEVDLYPLHIFTDPSPVTSNGAPVNVTLKAEIANSGNLQAVTSPVMVRFYDGDPQSGGVQIGADQFVTLAGCGDTMTVMVDWPAVPLGGHPVYVIVDPNGGQSETDEDNNMLGQQIVVASDWLHIPIIARN